MKVATAIMAKSRNRSRMLIRWRITRLLRRGRIAAGSVAAGEVIWLVDGK
jgi:hypothetical protein